MDILVLNYTEACNSQCATCDLWRVKDPKTLPLNVIERALSSARMKGLTNLYLTGGEPFLTEECVGIAQILARTHPGATISGATNALQPERYLRHMLAMRDAGVTLTLSISLNGAEEFHDDSRGTPGSHDNCLMLAGMMTAERIFFNFAYLDCRQGPEHFVYVEQLAQRYGTSVVVTHERNSDRYAHDTSVGIVPATRDFACRCPNDICCVWPDGDVTACEEDDPELVIGNLYEETLDEMDFDTVAAYVAAGNCRPCTMGCFEGK
jgi:sulfatase maturation enzyme AslB (radical SAM superfamily)